MGAAVIPVIQWGTALLAAGAAVQQGKEAQDYNEYLAKQSEADARTAQSAAEVEAMRIRKQRDKVRADAIATIAQSGVDVNSDTALRIDEQITRDSEEDAFLTLAGGVDRVNRLGAEAEGYRISGKQARTAGYVKAGTSLLGAASNNGRGWKRAGTAGGG